MTDLIFALILLGGATAYYYLKNALEVETHSRAGASVGVALNPLLFAHCWNFLFTLPLYLWLLSGPGKGWGLAPPGDEPSIPQWVVCYLTFWLRTVGVTQIVYAVPMARKAAPSAKGSAAGARMTASLSALLVFWDLSIAPSRSLAGPAAAGLAAIACLLYFLFTAAKLSRRGTAHGGSTDAASR